MYVVSDVEAMFETDGERTITSSGLAKLISGVLLSFEQCREVYLEWAFVVASNHQRPTNLKNASIHAFPRFQTTTARQISRMHRFMPSLDLKHRAKHKKVSFYDPL